MALCISLNRPLIFYISIWITIQTKRFFSYFWLHCLELWWFIWLFHFTFWCVSCLDHQSSQYPACVWMKYKRGEYFHIFYSLYRLYYKSIVSSCCELNCDCFPGHPSTMNFPSTAFDVVFVSILQIHTYIIITVPNVILCKPIILVGYPFS